jgi:hypothetical protein
MQNQREKVKVRGKGVVVHFGFSVAAVYDRRVLIQ